MLRIEPTLLLATLSSLSLSGCAAALEHPPARIGLLVVLPAALIAFGLWYLTRKRARPGARPRNKGLPDYDGRD